MWEGEQLVTLPALSVLAGVAAGLLGIGGGMVTSPLMLGLGVNPMVSAATASFMVLFTSSSTSLQFVIAGMLRADFALWYAAVGMVATAGGQLLADYYIRKTGRQSAIVLLVGLVIGLSCVAMGGVGLLTALEQAATGEWEAFHFQPLCHP